ncbi:hypothetical protein [Azospirillum sp. B4]|uniref:hypothetical protein n=1 Tax=Azospirillum sp. B4 TaxID=95605 RepID=UPI00034A2CF5|nr:hypothetical protein [Azospirillum sp. B4]
MFLLAVATAVGLTVVGNGVAARKQARAGSVALGAEQRAALAIWRVLDSVAASGKAPVSSNTGQIAVEGRMVGFTVMSEAGRIDLNGLSRRALAEAIRSLGFAEREAMAAADAIAQWRGMDPPGADGTNLAMDGRTALWSLEDLDAIPALGQDVRSCLRLWGTVHARGPFLGKAALEGRDFATTGFGTGGGLVVGSMIRVVSTDPVTGGEFRSVALFRGNQTQPLADGVTRSPWLILEWMTPTGGAGWRCPS